MQRCGNPHRLVSKAKTPCVKSSLSYIVEVNHAMSVHQSEKGVIELCYLLSHLTSKVLNPLQPH